MVSLENVIAISKSIILNLYYALAVTHLPKDSLSKVCPCRMEVVAGSTSILYDIY